VDEALVAEIVAADAELKGPSPDAWFDRLDGNQAALEEALAWSLEHDLEQSLRLAGAVWPYWLARGHVDSGRAWLAKVLAATEWGDRTAPRAKALYGAGSLAFKQGDREPSLRFHTESLAIARELGDQGLEADALIGLGRVAELDRDNPPIPMTYPGDPTRVFQFLEFERILPRCLSSGPTLSSATSEAAPVIKGSKLRGPNTMLGWPSQKPRSGELPRTSRRPTRRPAFSRKAERCSTSREMITD